ncbi:MAG: hypothetical protein HC837_11200 [Chloroflexaceae bacterium]|nr:hypothetical protein [Chloroflexaceae bacterium]
MPSLGITENDLEQLMLDWLQELGYTHIHGPTIAPGEPDAERVHYGDAAIAQPTTGNTKFG